MGVFATNTPGITSSKFNPTERMGFSNSTVIAHMAARHGSMVRNSSRHHLRRYRIGKVSVTPMVFVAMNPAMTNTTRNTTISRNR